MRQPDQEMVHIQCKPALVLSVQAACAVHAYVGAVVAFAVGLGVGFAVGFAVGFIVGLAVGLAVGFNFCLSVGFAVGFSVGLAVGFGVGRLGVGLGVGLPPEHMQGFITPKSGMSGRDWRSAAKSCMQAPSTHGSDDAKHMHCCRREPGGCGDAQVAAALVAAGNVLRQKCEGCRTADELR